MTKVSQALIPITNRVVPDPRAAKTNSSSSPAAASLSVHATISSSQPKIIWVDNLILTSSPGKPLSPGTPINQIEMGQ